jgi:hypothetical protein
MPSRDEIFLWPADQQNPTEAMADRQDLLLGRVFELGDHLGRVPCLGRPNGGVGDKCRDSLVG